MKKLWTIVASVLAFMGCGLLSACTSNNVSITLTESYKEICINADLSDDDKSVSVYALVNGVSNGTVSVSSSYEAIVQSSVSYNSSTGQNEIVLTGVSEGSAEVVVTSNYNSSVKEVIYVYVYSDIMGMDQVTEESGKSEAYALRGGYRQLSASELLSYTNSTSENVNRTDIVWTLSNEDISAGVTIENDTLYIPETYSSSTITITATALYNADAETDLTLTVIDPIDTSSMTMSYSYSLNTTFSTLSDGDTIKITPNISSDDTYFAYVRLTFKGTSSLNVTPTLTLNGVENSFIASVTQESLPTVADDTITYTYKIAAASSTVNGEVDCSFSVSYATFNYGESSSSFEIAVYEKINGVAITDADGVTIAENSTQNVYSSYVGSVGKEFNINFTPTTVVDKSGKFYIQVTYPTGGSNNTIDSDTISIYYKTSGGSYVKYDLTASGTSTYSTPTSEANLPQGVTQIYIIANSEKVTALTGVQITITSCDNADVSSSFYLNLYRSAQNLSFGENEEETYSIMHSSAEVDSEDITLTFTLSGQTSITGLSVAYSGEGITISQVELVSSDVAQDTVTFSITISINVYGITNTCEYYICHENGATSSVYTVELYLPLTEVTISYTSSNSQAVTASEQSKILAKQETNGVSIVDGASSSLSYVMLKTSSSLPLTISTNKENGYYSTASAVYTYYDYQENGTYTLDQFLALGADGTTADALRSLFNYASSNSTSQIANISNGSIVTTTATGYTWIVAQYTGKNSAGESVTFMRFILVQVHSPVKELSKSTSSVTLYAADSVSDSSITTANVVITLSDYDVTYNDISYFSFSSTFAGASSVSSSASGYVVSFANGYFSIENLIISGTQLNFNIVARTTGGLSSITDALQISYRLENIYIYTNIEIKIINADRVESVEYLNEEENGIYFEINDTSSQVIVTSVSPTNAKDTSLTTIVTDAQGNISTFVVTEKVSSNITIKLNTSQGTTGYIFILPSDAINNGYINYYLDGAEYSILSSQIATYYSTLYGTGNDDGAYFVNNSGEYIYFSNFLIRINVTVADGSSWDTAYRIYTAEEFAAINPTNYYVIMTDITLEDWSTSIDLTGGVMGLTEDITITLAGTSSPLFNTIGSNGETSKVAVQNITISAQSVSGGGALAKTNYGTVSNVTIDVYNGGTSYTYSSVSNSETSGTAGGLVGTNYGIIENCSALGVNVSAALYAGGLVGTNYGTISLSKVEIYNFESGRNSISASYAGGIVGYSIGGTISQSYVYDYYLSTAKTTVLSGSYRGSFIGYVGTGTSTISESFAVVGISSLYGFSGGTLSSNDYYIGYYSVDTYTVSYSADGNTDSNLWVEDGDSGFYSYVNGGYKHLKDVYQTEALSSTEIASTILKTTQKGSYYSSIATADGTQAALMFFSISSATDLSSSESAALTLYNTISLADLLSLGTNSSKVVAVFSKSGVMSISSGAITLEGTGTGTLTIYSKYDYSVYVTLQIEVVNTLSTISASYAVGSSSYTVEEGSQVSVQRTKSIAITYQYDNSYIYLASTGVAYNLDITEGKLNVAMTTSSVSEQPTATLSGTVLQLDTGALENEGTFDYVVTQSSLGITSQDLLEAVQEELNHSFSLKVFNGSLSLNLTSDTIAISPSDVGVVTAVLTSQSASDSLSVSISLGSTELTIAQSGSSSATYSYISENRLVVSWIYTTSTDASGSTIYTYTFSFEVYEDYRSSVYNTEEYTITLVSATSVTSKTFTLQVSKQNITNIDITTYSLSGAYNATSKTTQYQKGSSLTYLTPGSSALIVTTVNPEYAYYSYYEVTVSGASATNSLSLANMKIVSGTSSYYEIADSVGITNGILVTAGNIDNKSKLTTKLYISPDIGESADLVVTFNFYDAEANLINYVVYNISVSNLNQPTVYVDGEESALLVRGSSAEISIIVDYDQTVDLSSVYFTNVSSGISINGSWTTSIDTASGKRYYTATLVADMDAQLYSDADGVFYVYATVNRTINGVLDSKTAYAEVRLVDFKLDSVSVVSSSGDEDVFTTYLGVGTTLEFNYSLLPTVYTYDSSDASEAAKYSEVLSERNDMQTYGYYNGGKAYSINYNSDEGEVVGINTRLSYYSSEKNGWVSVYNTQSGSYSSVSGYLSWSYSSSTNSLTVTGLALTDENLKFKLTTYIYIGGERVEYDYEFEIRVSAYSTYDLPLCIWDEDDFLAMSEGDAQDYILMSDIVLTDYTPFSTSSIRSLDGNGYTIYVNSFSQSDGSTFTAALFDDVDSDTTLKNLIVNVYYGGQLTVNTNTYSDIQIAGLAISNSGIITNCQVVAFYSDTNALSQEVSTPGIYVKLTNGENSTEHILNANSSISISIAGFVITNNGDITNSTVGGKTVTHITNTSALSSTASATTENLDAFTIYGQGEMAGFVLTNSSNGIVSASKVNNVELLNVTENVNVYVSGFVGTNSGTILESYMAGAYAENVTSGVIKSGLTISATMAVIAGFVYDNESAISDCYTNTLISTDDRSDAYTYLASGFVYINSGTVENCYSGTEITNRQYSQMNFSGISANGSILNTGTYTNCYYYSSEDDAVDATEQTFENGATRLEQSTYEQESYYYGFSFATDASLSDGVWYIDSESGVRLVAADQVVYTHRYYQSVENGIYESEYLLPYVSTISIDGISTTSSYGSTNNPIVIRSAEEFYDVMGTSDATALEGTYTDALLLGTYRLVTDIDLSELLEENETYDTLPSSTRTLTGRFYGNGFTISNLSISSSTTQFGYGLFASIDGGLVVDLNIEVTQVVNTNASAVGVLAGVVRNASVVNVSVSFNESATVSGSNFTGGVAGLVIEDSYLQSINVSDATVVSESYDANCDESEGVVSISASQSLRSLILSSIGNTTITEADAGTTSRLAAAVENYSYSGSVAGYVDNFDTASRSTTMYSYSSEIAVEEYNVAKIMSSGTINVKAQVAGGVFGYVGVQTLVTDVGLVIDGSTSSNSSHIVATRFYAGGIVGQLRGTVNKVYAQYSSTTQTSIDNGIYNFYNGTSEERGALDIFETGQSETYYSSVAIGGIVGLAQSGMIQVAYSRLNVVSTYATYAGGVVGRVYVQNQTYNVSNNAVTDIITSLLLNEVYATGDVRSKAGSDGLTMSGGILGRVESDSIVSLMAVNALNEFSLVDYSTGENYTDATLKNGSDNYQFSNIGVYAIAGSNDGTIKFIKMPNYSDSSSSEEGAAVTLYDSVVLTEEYHFSSGVAKLTPYHGYASNTDQTVEGTSYDYTGYTNYTYLTYTSSIETGALSSSAIFLSSGLWKETNWVHGTDSLYPTIRYQPEQTEYVWLDAYTESMENVLQAIEKNPSVEVRVRGYNSKDSGVCVDIPLYTVLQGKSIDEYCGVTFTGKLVYEEEYGKVNNERTPRILLTDAMFDSVSSATITSVVFEFVTVDSYSTSVSSDPATRAAQWNSSDASSYKGVYNSSYNKSGGVVAGSIIESYVSGVSVYVCGTVYLSASSAGNGILASSVVSCTLSSNSVIYSEYSADQTAELLEVVASSAQVSNLYVGTVVGRVSSSPDHSTSSTMIVSDNTVSKEQGTLIGFQVSPSGSLTSATMFSDATIYVGGVFGKVERLTNDNGVSGSTISFTGNGVTPSKEDDTETDYQISISTIALSNTQYDIEKLVVGGYVGSISGTKSSIYIGSNYDINISIPSYTSAETTLEVGLIFGEITGDMNLLCATSSVSVAGRIYSTESYSSGNSSYYIDNLYIGGAFGYISSSVTITNMSVDVEMSHNTTADYTEDQIEDMGDSYTSTYDFNYIYAKNIYAGGIVGYSTSSTLTIRNTQGSTAATATSVNSNAQVMALYATGSAYVGSIAGYLSGGIAYISTTGSYTSNATLAVYGSSSYVGGLVGYSDAQKLYIGSSSADATYASIYYGGNIFSKNGGYIGGIVGSASSDKGGATSYTVDEANVFVTGTAFGGTIRLEGSAEISSSIGGIVGYINASDASANGYSRITNNASYGDLYIQGSTLTTQYYLGGIIGSASIRGAANLNNYVYANGNLSLFTNQSSITMDSSSFLQEEYINAVFGSVQDLVSGTYNYYSHGVNLMTDENDNTLDAGYATNYTDASGNDDGLRGYDRQTSGDDYVAVNPGSGTGMSMTEAIKTLVSQIVGTTDGTDIQYGTKLDPVEISQDTDSASSELSNYIGGSGYTSFNGMTYYVLTSDLTLSTDAGYYDLFEESNTSRTLTNAALIGDGYTISYSSSENDGTSLFDQIGSNYFGSSGYANAFVSSLSVIADNVILTQTTSSSPWWYSSNRSLGGIANAASYSEIFAVTISGSIEVASTTSDAAATVGGLVGVSSGVAFSYCASTVDITYRAGYSSSKMGRLSSITNAIATAVKPWNSMRSCYATGSLSTYIDCYVDAFAYGGSSSYSAKNCYTTSHIDYTDVTTTANNRTTYTSVFNTSATEGSISFPANSNYYIADAIEAEDIGSIKGIAVDDAGTLASSLGSFWESDINYNYGYPVLSGFNYLKVSSWFEAVQNDYVDDDAEARDIIYSTYTRLSTLDTMAIAAGDGFVVGSWTNASNQTQFYSFGIPNYEVLGRISSAFSLTTNSGNTKYFVLLNDIDTSLTSSTASPFATSTIYRIYLDGNDHIISDMTTTFVDVLYYSSEIRNLYINDTTIKVTSMSEDLKVGVLANTTYGSKISNVSLTGEISVSTSGSSSYNAYIGGVIGYATYYSNVTSSINTITAVTSSVNISIASSSFKSSSLSVGGLIGYARSTSSIRRAIIKYSQNYGQINVNDSGSSATRVGGLVGYAYYSDISYSYNAAAVLAGYTATNSKIYYAGGLVGSTYGTTTITDCYNTGMVKAGNKYSSSLAYAAGIVGYANSGVSISDSSNDAQIEALGKNISYQFYWEYYASTLCLTLRQTSAQNVSAAGIANNLSSTGTNVNYGEIINNGSYDNKDAVLGYWTYSTIKNGANVSLQSVATESNVGKSGGWYAKAYLKWGWWPTVDAGYQYTYNQIKYELSSYIYITIGGQSKLVEMKEYTLESSGSYTLASSTTRDTYTVGLNESYIKSSYVLNGSQAALTEGTDIWVTSYDDYGVPTSFNTQIKYTTSYQFYYGEDTDEYSALKSYAIFEWIWNALSRLWKSIDLNDASGNSTATITSYYSWNVDQESSTSSTSKFYYYSYYSYDESIAANSVSGRAIPHNIAGTTEEDASSMYDFTSYSYQSDTTDYTITVAGTTYVLTEGAITSNIFAQDLNYYTLTYYASTDYQDLSAKDFTAVVTFSDGTTNSFVAKSAKLNSDNDAYVVTFTVSSSKSTISSAYVEITQTETATISLSNINFVQNYGSYGSNSLAMEISSFEEEDGTTGEDSLNNLSEYVSPYADSSGNYVFKLTFGSDVYYMYKDGAYLVYVKDITLSTGTKVNTATFNVETLISTFAGQTATMEYRKTVSDTTAFAFTTATTLGTASVSLSSNTSTSTTTNSTKTSYTLGGSGYLTASSTTSTVTYDRSYSATLSTTLSDSATLSTSDGIEIATYDGSAWSVINSSVSYSGVTISISSDGSSLAFSGSEEKTSNTTNKVLTYVKALTLTYEVDDGNNTGTMVQQNDTISSSDVASATGSMTITGYHYTLKATSSGTSSYSFSSVYAALVSFDSTYYGSYSNSSLSASGTISSSGYSWTIGTSGNSLTITATVDSSSSQDLSSVAGDVITGFFMRYQFKSLDSYSTTLTDLNSTSLSVSYNGSSVSIATGSGSSYSTTSYSGSVTVSLSSGSKVDITKVVLGYQKSYSFTAGGSYFTYSNGVISINSSGIGSVTNGSVTVYGSDGTEYSYYGTHTITLYITQVTTTVSSDETAYYSATYTGSITKYNSVYAGSSSTTYASYDYSSNYRSITVTVNTLPSLDLSSSTEYYLYEEGGEEMISSFSFVLTNGSILTNLNITQDGDNAKVTDGSGNTVTSKYEYHDVLITAITDGSGNVTSIQLQQTYELLTETISSTSDYWSVILYSTYSTSGVLQQVQYTYCYIDGEDEKESEGTCSGTSAFDDLPSSIPQHCIVKLSFTNMSNILAYCQKASGYTLYDTTKLTTAITDGTDSYSSTYQNEIQISGTNHTGSVTISAQYDTTADATCTFDTITENSVYTTTVNRKEYTNYVADKTTTTFTIKYLTSSFSNSTMTVSKSKTTTITGISVSEKTDNSSVTTGSTALWVQTYDGSAVTTSYDVILTRNINVGNISEVSVAVNIIGNGYSIMYTSSSLSGNYVFSVGSKMVKDVNFLTQTIFMHEETEKSNSDTSTYSTISQVASSGVLSNVSIYGNVRNLDRYTTGYSGTIVSVAGTVSDFTSYLSINSTYNSAFGSGASSSVTFRMYDLVGSVSGSVSGLTSSSIITLHSGAKGSNGSSYSSTATTYSSSKATASTSSSNMAGGDGEDGETGVSIYIVGNSSSSATISGIYKAGDGGNAGSGGSGGNRPIQTSTSSGKYWYGGSAGSAGSSGSAGSVSLSTSDTTSGGTVVKATNGSSACSGTDGRNLIGIFSVTSTGSGKSMKIIAKGVTRGSSGSTFSYSTLSYGTSDMASTFSTAFTNIYNYTSMYRTSSSVTLSKATAKSW